MRCSTWIAGLALLLGACGELDGLDTTAEPVVSVSVRLDITEAALWQHLLEHDRSLENASISDVQITLHLHWARPPLPDPMCTELQGVFDDPECPVSETYFHMHEGGLSPDTIETSQVLAPHELSAEITLYELPPLGLGAENDGERLLFAGAFASVRDLRSAEKEPAVIGASWYAPGEPFERLAYREGRSADHSRYYGAVDCPDIPPGFGVVSADPTAGTCEIGPVSNGLAIHPLRPRYVREIACRFGEPYIYAALTSYPRFYDPARVTALDENFWSDPDHYTCLPDGNLTLDGLETSSPVGFMLSGYDVHRCTDWTEVEAPAFWPCPLPER